MKPIIIAPIVALALAGAGAGAYFLATGGGEEEEAAVAQPTPTPDPSASATAAPTATPEPTRTSAPLPDDWETYVDPELGFSFPHPKGWTSSTEYDDLPEKNGLPAVTGKSVSFQDKAGVPTIGFGCTPNPAGLSLEEWIATYPGWPTEPPDWQPVKPMNVEIGGLPGLLFGYNVLGERTASISFEYTGSICGVTGNVHGSAEGGVPPVISEEDFQRIVDEFSFSQ